MICTTFPGPDRARTTHGEFPFIFPVVDKSRVVPSDLVHDLEQFDREIRPLSIGAVSSHAGFLATIENRGRKLRRVMCVGLQRHENGGITGLPGKPVNAGIELAGSSSRSSYQPCTIRFDPAGTHLFAADYKGNIYVVEFILN